MPNLSEKYYLEDIRERGYSRTGRAIDQLSQKEYFIKLIRGLNRQSAAIELFTDKMRHLLRAQHTCLPKIIEYGFDNASGEFFIVYDYLNAQPLDSVYTAITPELFLAGIHDICLCLEELSVKERIMHGDISPANVLFDSGKFYLIDFALADLAETLSDSAHLVQYAARFTDPVKALQGSRKNLPAYDFFSLGKIIEWYFNSTSAGITSTIESIIKKCTNEDHYARYHRYKELISDISKAISDLLESCEKAVFVEFADRSSDDFINELNAGNFLIDIKPRSGDNIKFTLLTSDFLADCLWKTHDKKLVVLHLHPKADVIEKWNDSKRYSTLFSYVEFKFRCYNLYGSERIDLTPVLLKFSLEKDSLQFYKTGKKNTREELDFYKDLLNEELKVLSKRSLRLRYKKFIRQTDFEIHFQIMADENCTKLSMIDNHIDNITNFRSDGCEYIVSTSVNRDRNKEQVKFSGLAYLFNPHENLLYIRDCENIKWDSIPKEGYLFEDISQQEEEKNRQLDAIKKVEHNEVQNRELIHYLFNPSLIENAPYVEPEFGEVFQKDEHNNLLVYSPNQKKAIANALTLKPLSIIQGPPGTGKTTIITEIVFQLLKKDKALKILITSQTNNAVDNVLENLLEQEIPLVRLCGVTSPKNKKIREHTIDKKIEGWKKQVRDNAKKNYQTELQEFGRLLQDEKPSVCKMLQALIDSDNFELAKGRITNVIQKFPEHTGLISSCNSQEQFFEAIKPLCNNLATLNFINLHCIHKKWLSAISVLDEKSAINQKLVDSIRVVGATCNHIASKKYSKYHFEFDYVIMDESAKATTAEALVPIVLAQNLVFVGDHRQLRPLITAIREVEDFLKKQYKESEEYMIEGPEGWRAYLNRASLFENVIGKIKEDYRTQLTECRRCAHDHVVLTSKNFYVPFGDKAIIPVERPKDKEHNLDLKVNSSIIFFDTGSAVKSQKDNKKSSFNDHSAKLVKDILTELDKYEKIKNYSIGVITCYTAQVRRINKMLGSKNFLKNIRSSPDKLVISVVDRFQGLQNDIIILDLVRGGVGVDLGFLANANRMNVATSRQKRLLVIVGNINSLKVAKHNANSGERSALQNYLDCIKDEWIVNSVNQLF